MKKINIQIYLDFFFITVIFLEGAVIYSLKNYRQRHWQVSRQKKLGQPTRIVPISLVPS